MTKKLTKEDLFALNIIGTKKVCENRTIDSGHYLNRSEIKNTRMINRTRFLKICWNCGCAYESYNYNSYGCLPGCSWNIHYRLKNDKPHPVNMVFKTKAKNIKPILAEFGYV
ncbi:MAG: hypothetical protein A2033_05270 [Bacteroidetes bacterium GWA2_31_9]|nr:MAG: hypothetical protein A2033_05270 [Bacteroidetes bacterium GWA2_31_9]